MPESPKYLIFDIESVADGELVSRLRYPGENLSAADAVRKYRDELMAKWDSDFIPYTFQLPVALAIVKVAADYRLLDVVVLDEPEFRPHIVTDLFWRGWEHYKHPTLVTFNGRGFDMPLLELAAFRYGISLPGWYQQGKSFEQPRNRYNAESHLDLHDVLTNFGATRFVGGLNLVANLLGKPGKMDVQGHMVQDMVDAGRKAEVADYCRCDVLDTYFVFLRTRVLLGQLTLAREQELVHLTHQWLDERKAGVRAFGMYLERWGDWANPWEAPPPVPQPLVPPPHAPLLEPQPAVESDQPR